MKSTRQGKKRLSRREFLTSAATVAGAAALAACAPQPTAAPTPAPTTAPAAPTATPVPAPTKPKEKPKIVIWCGVTYTTEADAKQDEQIQEWCAKNNVDVEINRMSGDERTPKWKTAFETKQFPDMGALELNDAPKFMLTGVLVETTDLLNRLNKLEGGYTEGSWMNSMTPDGKHWTIPSFSSTEIFYVRKDKVEEKGLALPETWDDVLKVAKAITVPGQFWGWGAQLGTPSWDSEASLSPTMWSFGAKTWDEEGKPAIDSPETRQVIDFFKEAWDAGVIPPDAPTWDDSGNNKAYQTGIVGMVWNTGSILRYLLTKDKELYDKTEFMPVPKGPKGRFVSGYYYQWGVFKTSKYADICLELAEYLFSPPQLREVYALSAGNMMPVFKNMLNDPMWSEERGIRAIADSVAFTYPQGYPGSNKPWIQDAWMDHTVARMFGRVLFEGWDKDKAIAEAMAALQKWYDEWQAKLKELGA